MRAEPRAASRLTDALTPRRFSNVLLVSTQRPAAFRSVTTTHRAVRPLCSIDSLPPKSCDQREVMYPRLAVTESVRDSPLDYEDLSSCGVFTQATRIPSALYFLALRDFLRPPGPFLPSRPTFSPDRLSGIGWTGPHFYPLWRR